jgi:hypothetical protein
MYFFPSGNNHRSGNGSRWLFDISACRHGEGEAVSGRRVRGNSGVTKARYRRTVRRLLVGWAAVLAWSLCLSLAFGSTATALTPSTTSTAAAKPKVDLGRSVTGLKPVAHKSVHLSAATRHTAVPTRTAWPAAKTGTLKLAVPALGDHGLQGRRGGNAGVGAGRSTRQGHLRGSDGAGCLGPVEVVVHAAGCVRPGVVPCRRPEPERRGVRLGPGESGPGLRCVQPGARRQLRLPAAAGGAAGLCADDPSTRRVPQADTADVRSTTPTTSRIGGLVTLSGQAS